MKDATEVGEAVFARLPEGIRVYAADDHIKIAAGFLLDLNDRSDYAHYEAGILTLHTLDGVIAYKVDVLDWRFPDDHFPARKILDTRGDSTEDLRAEGWILNPTCHLRPTPIPR